MIRVGENATIVLEALRKRGPLRLSALTAEVHLPERKVDAALQQLRRAGKARFDPKLGWLVVGHPVPS